MLGRVQTNGTDPNSVTRSVKPNAADQALVRVVSLPRLPLTRLSVPSRSSFPAVLHDDATRLEAMAGHQDSIINRLPANG